MTATDDGPSGGRPDVRPPAEWKLPRLRIDVDGDWFDDDVKITHAGILANLRSTLRHDAQGYFIQTRVRIPVEVEDAPFVVTRIEVREASGDMLGALWGHLSDGSAEPLALDSFWIGRRDAPYCRVKGGRFTARLAVSAWLQLVPVVSDGPHPGEITLVVGRERVVLPRR